MFDITVYSTKNCSACKLLKGYLKENHLEYKEVLVDEDEEAFNLMFEKSGGVSSVPQIQINDQYLIGFSKKKLNDIIYPDDFLSGIMVNEEEPEVCESCQ